MKLSGAYLLASQRMVLILKDSIWASYDHRNTRFYWNEGFFSETGCKVQ